MGAQGVFLFSSYALHMVLARLLGPAGYGTYGVVFNLLSILFVVVSAGLPQAVARYVGADNRQAEGIRRSAFILQAGCALALTAALVVTSGPIAWLLADPGLLPYLQLSALSIPPYALYCLWASYLGGLHLFERQAVVVGLYGSLKVLAVCLPAVVWGLTGALAGLAVAPAAAIVVAFWLTPSLAGSDRGDVTGRTLVRFAAPFATFAVAAEALTLLDLFLAKAFVVDEAAIGFYTAASTIARVPYFLFIGLASAVLPAVARSEARGERETTAKLSRQALRVVILAAVPAVGFTAVAAGPVIDLLYSSAYAPAAVQLPLLTLGMSLASLFRVCANLEAGAGRERRGMVVGLLALAAGVAGGIPLTSTWGPTGAALTNLLMGAVASGLSLALLARHQPQAVPLSTAAKCLLAVLPAVALAKFLPVSLAGLALDLVGGAAIYLLALVALREVGPADLRLLQALLPGRKGARLRPD
jgi:O-antigen/teichoic acid export membrane protein